MATKTGSALTKSLIQGLIYPSLLGAGILSFFISSGGRSDGAGSLILLAAQIEAVLIFCILFLESELVEDNDYSKVRLAEDVIELVTMAAVFFFLGIGGLSLTIQDAEPDAANSIRIGLFFLTVSFAAAASTHSAWKSKGTSFINYFMSPRSSEGVWALSGILYAIIIIALFVFGLNLILAEPERPSDFDIYGLLLLGCWIVIKGFDVRRQCSPYVGSGSSGKSARPNPP